MRLHILSQNPCRLLFFKSIYNNKEVIFYFINVNKNINY